MRPARDRASGRQRDLATIADCRFEIADSSGALARPFSRIKANGSENRLVVPAHFRGSGTNLEACYTGGPGKFWSGTSQSTYFGDDGGRLGNNELLWGGPKMLVV